MNAPMSKRAAKVEARRRFSNLGAPHVYERKDRTDGYRCEVGYLLDEGRTAVVLGRGVSWADAFTAVDEKGRA